MKPETMEFKDSRRANITPNGEELSHPIPDKYDFASIAKISEVDRVYSDPEPILDRVLVMQGAAETFYAGTKFVIPESSRQAPNKGVVVKVGPAEGAVCKPGDIVTFSRFNAEPIDIDGEIYQMVRWCDIKLVERVTYAIAR
jgi:co-chaperonin GroES (HSP10)